MKLADVADVTDNMDLTRIEVFVASLFIDLENKQGKVIVYRMGR